MTEKFHPVLHAQAACLRADVLGPPAVSHDPQVQVRVSGEQASQDLDGMLDPLVGHEPAQHDQAGHLRLRHVEVGGLVSAVVDHGDSVRWDTEFAQLVLRLLRHRDVLMPAQHPRRDDRLDEPARTRRDRPEHDRPLLPVHVVDEHDHGRARAQGRPEGQTVLGVDDHIEGTLGPLEAAQPPHRRGIHPQPAPLAEHADALHDLIGGGVRVVRTQQGDVMPTGREPAADRLGVLLGSATFGVCRVTPVQKGNTHMKLFPDDRSRMLPQHPATDRRPAFRRDLRRSVDLFAAFRLEQSDPDRFYGALAADSTSLLGQWVDLAGAVVVDIGGGPGYFCEAFERAGSRYAGVEPDAGELTAHGAPGGIAVRGSGLELPFGDGCADVAFSSNVLEHVPDPVRMAEEMLRITRRGGLVFLSWTPWLSPHGGHETGMWHYLGGRRAADRYAARHGHRPKNDFGRSLFACPVGPMVQWARDEERAGRVEVLDVFARYHPTWAQWVMRVPGLREFASWNAVIVLRVRADG